MSSLQAADPKPPVKRGRKAKKQPKTPALVSEELFVPVVPESTESTVKRRTATGNWSEDDKSAKHND